MTTKDSHYLQTLWMNWTESKDEQAANELINHYMYLVDYHVDRFSSYIPATYDKNDLKSLGLMGLYDALHKFDIKRNLKFDTYATIRIRGSIIDGLRKEDWLPRTLRKQAKKIEEISEELEQRFMRTPTSDDIAKELGISKEEVERISTTTFLSNILSIEGTVRSNDKEGTLEPQIVIEDKRNPHPEERVLHTEQKKELARKIQQLTENEKLVISLFYNEELTLTEIGNVLNLTTSRISQIHKRAIFKLRNALLKQAVSR